MKEVIKSIVNTLESITETLRLVNSVLMTHEDRIKKLEEK